MTDRFGKIAAFYDELVGKYGHDPRAADYGRPESQRAKFDVLASALVPTDRTLLDVGCGFGDYARFLRERGHTLQYTGLDLSPAMIEMGQRLLPDVTLRVANVLDESAVAGQFDVVNANGIFYLLGEHAWQLTEQLVRRMFTLCTRMVAFTTLSTWAPDQEPGEFYADPGKLLELCRSITPKLVLRHDYHRRDMALFLYR